MACHVTLIDGPLQGCCANLWYRPLDGEVHLFSDQSISDRGKSYHYEFSEFRQGFRFLGQSDIQQSGNGIEITPSPQE